MTLEHVRRAHATKPFEPFDLHLADGRTVRVPHQEFLWIPPKAERCIYVSDNDGVAETIDLLLVVSLKPVKNGRRRSAR